MSSIENISNSPRLNGLKISILRLFSQSIPDDKTLEIRKLMMNYWFNYDLYGTVIAAAMTVPYKS
jgi:hypothetical protein